jgi:hypothetical protein
MVSTSPGSTLLTWQIGPPQRPAGPAPLRSTVAL